MCDVTMPDPPSIEETGMGLQVAVKIFGRGGCQVIAKGANRVSGGVSVSVGGSGKGDAPVLR